MMRAVRTAEQKRAAEIGAYGAQIMLNHSNATVKVGSNKDPVEDIAQLIEAATTSVVYTNDFTDKHDTHVAVTVKVIEAICSLPDAIRPQWLCGCEVWRGLDWMKDEDRVVFDCLFYEDLQIELLNVYGSQISGSQRIDLAAMDRRRANAIYYATHTKDVAAGMVFAMNLTPLAKDPSKSLHVFVSEYIDRFANEVLGRLVGLQ